MKWLFDRFSEPSSWGGLGAITFGAGELFKIGEAPAVVGVIGQAAEQVVATGNPMAGFLALGFGVLGVIFGEKGRR